MYSNLVETGDAREDSFFQPTPVVVKAPEQQQPQQQQQPKQLSPKKPLAGGVSAILETERTRRMSMPSALTGPGGRRLSIPFSEQRRRSSYGVYSRVVMCAVDASGHSKDAFMWYLNNVWRMDDLIVICYCPEPPAMSSFSFKTGLTLPTERWKEILDEANAKTRKLEEDYEQLCIEKKLRYKIRGESYKNAGEGLCRIADDEAVNLIVMGSRGMSALKRAFIGSVSEYVVRNASVPCLVIPAPK